MKLASKQPELRTPLGILALLMTLFLGIEAKAQTCFPLDGGGVPYQPGLPDFWTGSAGFDDPRWRGSFAHARGHMKFQALVDTTGGSKALVLKWHVEVDPGDTGPAGPGDDVFLGLYNPTTHVGTVLRFSRATTTSISAGTVAGGAMTLTAWSRDFDTANNWGAPTTAPSTVSTQARIDAVCGVADPIVCDQWTIRARIPMTAAAGGVDLADTFSMWFENSVITSAGIELNKWPNGATAADPTADPFAIFPSPTAAIPWNPVDVSGGGGVTCTQGIALSSSQITVANAIGTGSTIDVDSPNVFHARPSNLSPTTYNPDAIKARFRIANWGSSGGTDPQWDVVPDCGDATGSGAPASITAGTGAFDLTCSWTLTAAQKCSYRPDLFPGCTPDPALGSRHYHQCILVDLTKNTTSSATFSPDSSWRNMNFDEASKLVRAASIQVSGITPVPTVYLYVQTRHMPETVPPPGAQADNPFRSFPDKLQRGFEGALPGRVGTKHAALLKQALATGALTDEQVTSVMPTYIVHVWHEAGGTLERMGTTHKVLAAQPSYGLYLAHDGDLTGWKHSLTSSDGELSTIGPNFYRLDMKGKTNVVVETTIESVDERLEPTEEPKPAEEPAQPVRQHPPFWHALLWLLALLVVLLLIGLLIRAQKKKP